MMSNKNRHLLEMSVIALKKLKNKIFKFRDFLTCISVKKSVCFVHYFMIKKTLDDDSCQ